MKKPLLFGIDYKEMKRLAFGEKKNEVELKNARSRTSAGSTSTQRSGLVRMTRRS